ncbi:MAG: 16S rRNA (guanine(966)-N(2))-methyltransferase RsmD [Xanthomonadales bacterium]|nr:16S rRNA (guanine(966)-N(2))-methyltransferase RsmD [Xanthomonadales bacterium]
MSKSGKNNGVRIIGGDWRGRRLPVADVPGLRPSGDRCRETLFNWLQPWILDADCVDLFAGTGALGFEAASRGAASVLMIEKHPRAQEVLGQSIEQLQAVQVNLHRGGAMSMIEEFKPDSFDIVFVDPPFDSNLTALVLERLDKTGCVRRGGFVYVESPAQHAISPPEDWRVWRDQQLGDVRMQLFRRQMQEDERNLLDDGSD